MNPEIKRIITVILLLGCAGCMTLPLQTPVATITAGKQYVPIPENMSGAVDAKKAGLFFITNIRDNIMGIQSRGDIRVIDGNIVIGDLQNASYLYWEREPGVTIIKYTLPGKENSNDWFSRTFNTFKIKAEGGQSYYLFLGGYAQRRIIAAQDAKALLSLYPQPIAGLGMGTPTASTASGAMPVDQTNSSSAQKPV